MIARVKNTVKKSKMYAKLVGHDCNGAWIKGSATATGHTYAVRGAQGTTLRLDNNTTDLYPERSSGRERQVSYVAIPSDPKGRIWWGTGRAGNLGGGPGGGLLNDRGVCVLTSGCSYSTVHWTRVDESCAPGVKDFILASYGVIFAKSAREAAKLVTVGPRSYRKATGRKTVLRGRGANIVFGDV